MLCDKGLRKKEGHGEQSCMGWPVGVDGDFGGDLGNRARVVLDV